MFFGSSVAYGVSKISDKDKELSLDYCQRGDKTFYVHAPLNCNLAQNNNTRMIKTLAAELDSVIGLPGAVVAHIGFGKEILSVAETINQLEILGVLKHSSFERVPFHFLLECASGKNNQLGHTWHDLWKLYEALDKSKVGLCIDTQHAFSAGLCKFSEYEEVVKLWEGVESFTPRGISMLHLNDSLVSFGNGNDRHAPLETGHIWHREKDGLKALLSMARDKNLDLISETSDVANDINLVERYIG